jgi:chemotaxis protein methyltransferase WspC
VNETRKIIEMLASKIGLAATSIGEAAVVAAVETRCAARNLALRDYAKILTTDSNEQRELFDELSVPETWFMRDDKPFEFVAQHGTAVCTKRRLRNDARPFRVLSVPCSSGEEPYSIAMALLDAGLDETWFQIDAMELSTRSLQRAARAIYGGNSFRSRDLSFRGRYFSPVPGAALPSWQLHRRVQSLVRFRQGNILESAWLASQTKYDAIFCRNLIIYLTVDARAAVLNLLHSLLSDDGVFVAGHSEAMEILDQRFGPLSPPVPFAYQRRLTVLATPNVATVDRSSNPRAPLPIAVTAPSKIAATAVPPPQTATTQVADRLAAATQAANRGALVEAARLCEEHLQHNDTDSSAWCLLGTIRQANRDHDRAEQCFSRALYLDPACALAMTQLAFVAERRGDHDKAALLRRRAANIGAMSR